MYEHGSSTPQCLVDEPRGAGQLGQQILSFIIIDVYIAVLLLLPALHLLEIIAKHGDDVGYLCGFEAAGAAKREDPVVVVSILVFFISFLAQT